MGRRYGLHSSAFGERPARRETCDEPSAIAIASPGRVDDVDRMCGRMDQDIALRVADEGSALAKLCDQAALEA